MAVIESIMLLYSREVITSDRVVAAVQRFGHSRATQIPSTHEQGALLWIQHACDALKGRIEQESGGVVENGGSVSFSEILNSLVYYWCDSIVCPIHWNSESDVKIDNHLLNFGYFKIERCILFAQSK